MIDGKHGLLVIGTSQKPRCFDNVRAFPADYSFSKITWIANGIWSDWLRKWDRNLCFQNRKIALLVDNCSAHGDVEELKCIEVEKLPPNTTSLIQPRNMGIIRTLKAYCRQEIRARIIDAIEDGCNDSSISANTISKRLSVLDELHILAGSWNKVTKKTIRNCWRKVNIFSAPEKQELEFETPIPVPKGVAKEQFKKWLDIENDVRVHAELTLEEEETELMQEIVANSSASGPEIAELEEAENDEAAAEEPPPSNAEMRSILHRLRIGLERRGFERMQTFEAFDDNVLGLLRQTPLKQMKPDAFF